MWMLTTRDNGRLTEAGPGQLPLGTGPLPTIPLEARETVLTAFTIRRNKCTLGLQTYTKIIMHVIKYNF